MKIPVLPGSLRSVLALQVALPVLAILAAILAISLTALGQFVENRMQRDLQLVARAIHLPVMQALARNDLEQLQSNLASVFSMGEVYGAYLFDGEGRRLVSFGRERPTRAQAGDALKLSREGQFEQYENIRGQNVYSFFLPLFDEIGQPDGLLQVTRLRSDFDQAITRLTVGTWVGFAFAALLILVALSMGHQRAIGRPLAQLVGSMQRVERGEREHRAEEQGPRELRQLARRLNEMLDAIRDAEAQAERQRTENARIEAQLRRSETLAALGQLSAGVAHELGAPLSVVDGRARRLLRVATDGEGATELREIREQVARMTSIIEQLLAFARGSRAEHRQLDVGALVERATALCADEGPTPRIEGGPDARVRGDALGLEQALVNLVRNARQARPGGEVSITWREQGGRVVIVVDDDGPGVPEAERACIFEPFFTTKTPGEGTGLGLAIVQRVVREHGGEARVSASPAGGARFELHLPRDHGREATDA
ncbi:sensor histidine kinase [Pseudazoarcus pumilus]|uniref:histidine kinase n=1 Tax=Pseudazoarcus pumilus TaxID=2067960 RepID=A0A2I6S971_9RHOO|nr:HAMP domain-containing sensor histidine kinase [Pseudazoarcus pumilus]AUN95802.1 sensor histidine kinase [Pseudazoarcus pumilus]